MKVKLGGRVIEVSLLHPEKTPATMMVTLYDLPLYITSLGIIMSSW
jgi:hypothetical protein